VSDDLSDQVERNKKLLGNYSELEAEMKRKVIETHRLKDANAALGIKFDREHELVKKLREDLEKTETPLLLAHNEIESLRKEVQSIQRHETQLSKETVRVAREKEVQMKATERAEAKGREQQDMYIEKEREATSLSIEMQAHVDENRRLRKAISALDSDRERLGNEVGEQRSKYVDAEDKLKLKEIEISELNKCITEGKNREKHQQQLYEAVRADRNHYSKGLLESQDEVAELKKKFKILGHQIEQLKEEISLKDQAIVKEHGDFQKAEKKSEISKRELSTQTQLVKTCHDLIHQQENELKNLTTIVRRMDEEAVAQRKEYDQVINERDILGTQLIRRNDELALLYEKLRIQQSGLKKGEVQYSARMDDIRLLKLRLKEYERENSLSKGSGAIIEELKREILQFQRELLQEKTKVTALSEELENPMNVHRWRKLEGSDPATFELIQKIQTLQRRLISKTEEVVEKGLMIQEKEKLYSELKGILARQPGPEVAEQLAVYQQNLKRKTSQLKGLASELNMCQAQVNEYKYEQERLVRELTEMKRKYYSQKTKTRMVEEADYFDGNGSAPPQMSRTGPQSLHNEQTVAAKSARIKYAGGGFAIK
jgi:chromosome segregation ATPase